MFNIGDVVKVVDARPGTRRGPDATDRKIPYYKELLGKEFTIHHFYERINCYYDEYGNSFYPWRLELASFSLENE